jgi:hypothetical protein
MTTWGWRKTKDERQKTNDEKGTLNLLHQEYHESGGAFVSVETAKMA